MQGDTAANDEDVSPGLKSFVPPAPLERFWLDPLMTREAALTEGPTPVVGMIGAEYAARQRLGVQVRLLVLLW